jgi:hypothetical protein
MEYVYVVGWVLGVVGGTFCFAALQWPGLFTFTAVCPSTYHLLQRSNRLR